MSDREERLRTIGERAAAGSWSHEGPYLGWSAVFSYPENGWIVVDSWPEGPLVCRDVDEQDAKFIAHSREDVPYLLAEIARLEAERDALTRALPGLLADYEQAIYALYHDEPTGQSYGIVKAALAATQGEPAAAGKEE